MLKWGKWIHFHALDLIAVLLFWQMATKVLGGGGGDVLSSNYWTVKTYSKIFFEKKKKSFAMAFWFFRPTVNKAGFWHVADKICHDFTKLSDRL